jgi:Uri superfamily endonuclease
VEWKIRSSDPETESDMMNKEQVIVNVLLEHEHELSDGYYYYTGYTDESIGKVLSKIAKEIISKLEDNNAQS